MPKKTIPKYRLHKASGQASVTLKGKTFYLGKFKCKESYQKYNALIAQYIANQQTLPPALTPSHITCQELAVQYLDYMFKYYCPNGEIAPPYSKRKVAVKGFVQHFGTTPVAEFTPLSLVFLRDKWVEHGYARPVINEMIGYVKAMFRWGTTYLNISHDISARICMVDWLKRGHTTAREFRKIPPIEDTVIEQTLKFTCEPIGDMIRIQRLIAGRPQDVRNMRACDIDQSKEIWKYAPYKHKTQNRGRTRILAVGPKAQEILIPLLQERKGEDFVFQINGKQVSPMQYPRGIAIACKEAGIPVWAPNRIRHTAGTDIREKYGLEVASLMLGHSTVSTSETYAELNYKRMETIAKEIG
jgi:integrase